MSSTSALPLDNASNVERGVSLSAEAVLNLTSSGEETGDADGSATTFESVDGFEDDVDGFADEIVESQEEKEEEQYHQQQVISSSSQTATLEEKEIIASNEERTEDIPIVPCQAEAIPAIPITITEDVPVISPSTGTVPPTNNSNQILMATAESTLYSRITTPSSSQAQQNQPLPLNYEILPGLWARLNHDATVEIIPAKEENGEEYMEINVTAKDATLGEYFFSCENVRIQAKLYQAKSIITDLVVSIDHMELDRLVNRKQVERFLEYFCTIPKPTKYNKNKDDNNEVSLPRRRLTRVEWEQFMMNSQNDNRVQETATALVSDHGSSRENSNGAVGTLESDEAIIADAMPVQPLPFDKKCPYANVRAVQCDISFRDTNGHGTFNSFIKFPDCEGSAECTLRTLLKYYCQSILSEIDILSGNKAGIDTKTVTSDMTSVGGGALGASAGAALLGPVGLVAGSFLGSRAGRKHSTTVIGATAGAAVFGPVGLVVGACCVAPAKDDDETEKNERNVVKKSKSVRIDDFGNKKADLGRAASEHLHANKYDIGGSTGVAAGAAVGAMILGPVGLLAGAAAGSVSGRKIVEKASSAVSRGKESRGADPEREGYRFGDFTRGLFRSATSEK